MIIKKIELKNIKSYKDGAIDFREGITSLYGLNGAGKSTVLEAIGFALFDFSPPYNQSELIRNGEKTGEISVTFTGSDGIDYIVRRKIGASPSFAITDNKGIMVERKEEVASKLCDILGYSVQDIGQLRTLFENAVGVPQGTFVSEFLGTQSKRKPIFDPLMRIDEYNRAYDNLLGLKNFVKDSLIAIDIEISRIEGKAEGREKLEKERDSLKEEKMNLENTLSQKGALLRECMSHKASLDNKEDEVKELENKRDIARTDMNNKKTMIEKLKKEFSAAEEAREKLALFEPAYKQYLEKRADMDALNDKKGEMDRLNKIIKDLDVTLAGLKAKVAGYEGELAEMQKLEAEIKRLEPLAVEQEKLESERRGLAAEISAKKGEKQQLMERKMGLKIASGNRCPLMPNVECKSVSDLPKYFDSEILRVDGALRRLEKENDELSQKLKGLEDPRLAIGGKRESLKRRDSMVRERDRIDGDISRKEPEREKLSIIIKKYEGLDDKLKTLNEELHSLIPAYESYQQNVKLAETYELRKGELESASSALGLADSQFEKLSKGLESVQSAYDKSAHEKLKKECERSSAELASLQAKLDEKKAGLDKIEGELAILKEHLIKLKRLKDKKRTEEKYLDFIMWTRRIIKDAGSRVIDKYLLYISLEATKLYREIAGDNRVEIKWNREYDIILIEEGRERAFRQLSGGEQMTASLAVRLAIIKALMDSDIVFLDEPTQNLDESRRERLAQEIMRIKDFKQMIIISHDDTFNASLENVIEIEKINGESRVRRRTGYAGPQATLP